MGECLVIEDSDCSTKSAIGSSEAVTVWVDASRLDRAQLLHIEGPFSARHVRARRIDRGVVAICEHWRNGC